MPKLSQESLKLVRAAAEAEREVGSARLATALDMLIEWHDRQGDAEAPKTSTPAPSRAAIDVLAERQKQIAEDEFDVAESGWFLLAKAAYLLLGNALIRDGVGPGLTPRSHPAAHAEARREMVHALAMGLAAIEALDITIAATDAQPVTA